MSSQPPPSRCSAHLAEHKAPWLLSPHLKCTNELPQEEPWLQTHLIECHKITTKCQWGEVTETAPDDDDGEEEHERKEKGKEKKKERRRRRRRKKPRKRGIGKKMDMEHTAEDAAEDVKGAPPKLTLVEKWLTDEGATIAPPEHPRQEPMASSLPPPLSISTTQPSQNRA
ncbi:hypothetical protein CPB84DRAFT_1854169 [Gymnopilus junonius]|uniref:Uncharacterized protein n=1 Tax=Gymnopilus junonius TaxID=109634 RepID=A0A9P5N924_GYMJU|nr:hypothetical protein CPB84DRAFT_1854169 [Gymnopilus junonius]